MNNIAQFSVYSHFTMRSVMLRATELQCYREIKVAFYCNYFA